MQVKPWYKSKMIWFNVATFIVAIGTELISLLELSSDPEFVMVFRVLLVTFVSSGNVILRMVTNKGLE